MQSIINHLLKYETFRSALFASDLLKYESVQKALIAAGWTPPVVQNIGGGKGEE